MKFYQLPINLGSLVTKPDQDVTVTEKDFRLGRRRYEE